MCDDDFVKLTLTYRGALPSKQRGVAPTKAVLRSHFHNQIRAQLDPLMVDTARDLATTHFGGYSFLAPAHSALATAVELDVLLLVPATTRKRSVTDVDNRLKTLIDGLTRPVNDQQMVDHKEPEGGGPTYCLLDDDALVKRISLDSRRWFEDAACQTDALVVVTATLVLGDDAHLGMSTANMTLVI